MNWNNNTEVSNYLSSLCLLHKEKPKFLPVGPKESIMDIENSVGKDPIVILDDIIGGSASVDAYSHVENTTIVFFVLVSEDFGSSFDFQPTIEKTKKIGKDFVAKIIVDHSENEYTSILGSEIEEVIGLNGTLYGVMLKVNVRGSYLEYDSDVWEF